MGGSIRIDSAPGRGTCFEVILPLPAETGSGLAERAVASEKRPRPMYLLLVEDCQAVADVLVGLLQVQGHRVVHVEHGLAALSEVAAAEAMGATFDVALLDLDLPGMDGLALARQLRMQGFTASLVAVTARADAEVEGEAKRAGFDCFLRKPLTGAMLARALGEVVDSAMQENTSEDGASEDGALEDGTTEVDKMSTES